MPLSKAEVVPEWTNPGSEPGPPEGKNVVSIKLLISHCEGEVCDTDRRCANVLFMDTRGCIRKSVKTKNKNNFISNSKEQ